MRQVQVYKARKAFRARQDQRDRKAQRAQVYKVRRAFRAQRASKVQQAKAFKARKDSRVQPEAALAATCCALSITPTISRTL